MRDLVIRASHYTGFYYGVTTGGVLLNYTGCAAKRLGRITQYLQVFKYYVTLP